MNLRPDPDDLKEQIQDLRSYVSKEAFAACLELEKNQLRLTEQHRLHSDRCSTLQKQDSGKLRPLFQKRDSILKEVAASELVEDEDEDEEQPEPVQGVPDFWLRALRGCTECDKAIKDRDEEALLSLTRIQWEVDAKSGEGKLKFHFGKNEFFTDKTLTKSFPSLEGTEVNWKEGKNLTRKAAAGGGKKKGKKGQDDVKEKAVASFFQIFITPDQVSKYLEQQKSMVTEIIGLLGGTDDHAFDLFLGGYRSAPELLEAIGLEPDQFEDCYQSRVVQDRIRRLGEVYSQVDAAAKSGGAETLELNRKLQVDCEELYQQRAVLVDGNGDPNKRPVRFWLQCILNSEHATHFVGLHDDRVLKYVKDIQGDTADNGDETVRMLFWDNPYFSNEELVRTMCEDGTSEGTVVEWKDDQNGDSMQYKLAKKGKYGKMCDSVVWAFDLEPGPLSNEEIQVLHYSFLRSVIPNALYLYIRTPDALEGDDDEDEDDDEEEFASSEEEDEDDAEDNEDDQDEEGDVASKAKSVASRRSKQLAEKNTKAGGLFGTKITLLHVFVVMIISSQVLSFFMSSGM